VQDHADTCEIVAVYTDAQGTHARFWARATNAEGVYNAGESPEFACSQPIRQDRAAGEALRALIQTLVQDGWDPLDEHGPQWFSYRFHRPSSYPAGDGP
jgi:hypothetical protein